jgi:hypothetical protein
VQAWLQSLQCLAASIMQDKQDAQNPCIRHANKITALTNVKIKKKIQLAKCVLLRYDC